MFEHEYQYPIFFVYEIESLLVLILAENSNFYNENHRFRMKQLFYLIVLFSIVNVTFTFNMVSMIYYFATR